MPLAHLLVVGIQIERTEHWLEVPNLVCNYVQLLRLLGVSFCRYCFVSTILTEIIILNDNNRRWLLPLLYLDWFILKILYLILETVQLVQIGRQHLLRITVGLTGLVHLVSLLLFSQTHTLFPIFSFLEQLKLLLIQSFLFFFVFTGLMKVLMGVLPWVFPEFRQRFAKLDIINHNRIFFLLIEFHQQLLSSCYPVEWSTDHAESGEVTEVKHVSNALHWFKISDQSYIPPLPCFIGLCRLSCEKSKVHITMSTLLWAQSIQPRWSSPLPKATTQPRCCRLSRSTSVFSQLRAPWPCICRLFKEGSSLGSWAKLSKLMFAKLSFLIGIPRQRGR